MANDMFGARVSGAKEVDAALAKIQRNVDKGTKVALKRVQTVAKTSIKSGMRGRPRWDRRGRSKIYPMGVNLDLNPHHVSKSGGPGKFTGALFRSIRGSKRPRREGNGAFSAVVMAGSKYGPQNIYKTKVEATYPYFKPGIEKAKPKMPAVWEAAWAKATNKP